MLDNGPILKANLKEIVNFLHQTGLQKSVVRTRIFKNKCAVVDFAYSGFKFAFDFTPSEQGGVTVDLVERASLSKQIVTSTARPKERILDLASLPVALETLKLSVDRIIADIDKYLGLASQSAEGHSQYVKVSPPHSESKARPLKVGVMTLALNENIGGTLQAYALMEALRQLGHHPALINRRPQSSTQESALALEASADLPLMASTISIAKKVPTLPFIEKYISPITQKFTSTAALESRIEAYQFDAIIVGSDQVWRPKYAKSMLMDLFLGFVPAHLNNLKKISYAASFGAPKWEFDEKQTAQAERLLSKFQAVSVREDSAVGLCRKNLGVEAKHVLDPTLLHNAQHYIKSFALESRREPTGNGRLVAYILDRTPDKISLIESIAGALSLDAFNTKDQKFFDEVEGRPADETVESWVCSFYDAEFVVTDSFHGVAFSIIFNKPFVAYGNPNRGMARFTSLLKMFGLNDRLVVHGDGQTAARMQRPIDWGAVNLRLETLRADSLNFLKISLGQRSNNIVSPAQSQGLAPPNRGRKAVIPLISESMHSVPECKPLNVLCSGCGVCVSEADGKLAMAWTHDGFLVPQALADDIPAKAIKVCPFNPNPEEAVRDEDSMAKIFLPETTNYDPRAGRFERSYIGFSKKFRVTSSSGGIATYVFEQLLKRDFVDYLFVVQSDGGNGYKYQVFDGTSNIKSISKTRYSPVSLDELFNVIESRKGRVAVSGVACFIKAVRLKQYYYPALRQKIAFLVGIICGGLKSKGYTDYLAQSAGITGPYTKPNYRVKDSKRSANDYSFSAVDAGSKSREVRMSSLGDMWGTGLFKARACDFCTDVLTELSDISLGDAWLPEYKTDGLGNSVVITRSALAQEIIGTGLATGELVLQEAPISRIVRSQGGGFRHKHTSLQFRVWASKQFSSFRVPVVRERLFTEIPISEALIQIRRERARSKSLLYWRNARDASDFRKKMRGVLEDLKVATLKKNEGANPLIIGQPITRWLIQQLTKWPVNFGFAPTFVERSVESKDVKEPG